MKFKWTLYRKIQVIIIIILLLVLAVSQSIFGSKVSSALETNYNQSLKNTTELINRNIESVFDDAFRGLEVITDNYRNMLRDDAFVREYLHMLVSTNSNIMNAYVAYDDKSFVLEPVQEISSDFDPTTRDWYTYAMTTEGVFWTPPYEDEGSKQLVISASEKFELEDIVGVAGVDINLMSIPETIEATKIGERGYVALIKNEDEVLLVSNNMKEILTLGIDDSELALESRGSGHAVTKKGVYYIRYIDQAALKLIVFAPHSDIASKIQEIQYYAIMIFFAALMVGILLSWLLTKRITRPMEDLAATMKQSLTSDKLLTFKGKTNDDISTLIDGYNQLVVNVNENSDALKKVSNELIISEQKLHEQYEKVKEMAYYDYLTGLPNRLVFEQQARMMIDDKKPFAVMYADLDNFKYINDTYGHNYGDYVLQILSKRFKDCCGGKHFCARLSGDEFGILHSCDMQTDLDEMAKGMLNIIQEPIRYNELEFSVTGSIGISMYPEDGRSFEDLLSNADIAMYEAKNKSKNQYKIFNQQLRNELIDRVNMETKLTSALVNDEIYLCYQPLVDFKTRKVKGFEALVRWNSIDLGPVSPNVFIPIAEHNLFINELGYFVLEEAIKFGVHVYETYGKYYEMNVNVSLIQLHIERFVDEVHALLDRYKFPAQYLNLEITESVALESDEKIHSKLKALRASGIKLSLDDFGTGYSSLQHLLNIRLSHLKIDRMIILQATNDREVYRLIRGIVDFAHAIGLKVVAEGIENTRMENLMNQMNIDYAQGYLYSKPIIDQEIIKFIKEVDSI